MSKKPTLNKCNRDKELFWYLDAATNKRWLYRHRYYDVLGKRREKQQQGFNSESSAYRALCEVRAKLVTGNSIEVEHENMRVAEWVDIWFESNKGSWRKNTIKQRASMIRDQFKPLLGKYKLSSLDKETYKRQFIQVLLKDYKPSTVRLFHRVFKVAINAAVDNEIISRNRFTKVVVKDDDRENDVTVLSKQELKTVLEYVKQNETLTINVLFHFLAYTGCRRGEAFGLQWRDLDFDNNQVTFERQRNKNEVGPLKTKNSYRTIDIDPLVMALLKKYRTWCKQLMLEDGRKINDDEDFVFVSYQTREPFADNSLFYAFERVKARSGITAPFTPHVFRHTHATLLLLSAKVDVTVVADRLGNTPKVVWETYAHVLDEAKKEVVEIFGEAVKF